MASSSGGTFCSFLMLMGGKVDKYPACMALSYVSSAGIKCTVFALCVVVVLS